MKKKVKKAFVRALIFMTIIVFFVTLSANDGEHIVDINGDDNYALHSITDEDIINRGVDSAGMVYEGRSAMNLSKHSSYKFTGIYEVNSVECDGSDLQVRVTHPIVKSGNIRLLLMLGTEIVHEFMPNELMQAYTFENVTGNVSLVIVAESASFELDYEFV